MSERRFLHRDEEIVAEITRDGDQLTLQRDGSDTTQRYEARRVGTAEYVLSVPDDDDCAVHTLFAVRDGDDLWVHLDGRTHLLQRVRQRGGGRANPGGLVAPTPATVQEVLVADGDSVTDGQVLIVLTSMKMQIEIKAPLAGTVEGLSLKAGDQVDAGVALLRVVEPAE
jgi:biotin carboxyl carrier protein